MKMKKLLQILEIKGNLIANIKLINYNHDFILFSKILPEKINK